MEGNVIKLKVQHGRQVLKELEEYHPCTLPGLVEGLENVRKSINDYLTDLIDLSDTKHSESTSTNNNEDEEDDIGKDALSEVLNEITGGTNVTSKRKSNREKNAKRLSNKVFEK